MSEPESAPIRVLHVDDDPGFVDLVKTYLERIHDALNVTTVNSGADALAQLSNNEFDCIVSDYNMPEMDGLELLETVQDEYPDLPFILFTGRGSEEIASEAISAGVTDYLQKETGTDQYTVLANRIVNAVNSYRSEQALAESKQRYQTLVEKSHDAVFILQESEFTFVNGKVSEVTGYDETELKGREFLEIVHPDDRDWVCDMATRRREGKDVPETHEICIETKTGETRYCEVSVQAITYEGEYAVLGSARDITDQREYETTLETLHDTARELMRGETKREICKIAVETARTKLGLPITGIWLYDEDANQLEPEIHTDRTPPVIDSPPIFEPGDSLAWTVFRDQESIVFDDLEEVDLLYNPDTQIQSEAIVPLGTYGVLMSGSTEVDAFDELDREFLELLAMNTEAALERANREADYRQLTQELKQSKQKIEQLHDIATEMEACTSEQEICDLTVDAAERILEFDICVVDIEKDGLLETRSLSSGIRPEETPSISVNEGIAGKTYQTGEPFLYDDIQTVSEAVPESDYRSLISIPIGDHGVFQAATDTVGFFDEQDSELAELLLSHTCEALTRVEREQQLRESEARLRQQKERLEEFASIVSHDLRNPLNVAQGNLELAREDTLSAGPESDGLETAATALDRMEAIIQEVLTLARQGQVVDSPETVQFDRIVERAWTNVETADATLTTDCDCSIRADSGRLQQLLENLFRNAIEHGGTDVTVRVDMTDNGFVVEDTGCGLPDIRTENLFSSEYSTSDNGTGLGLAIVDQIVQAHGWEITATESRDGGARFEIQTS